jgi:hypothetical protein
MFLFVRQSVRVPIASGIHRRQVAGHKIIFPKIGQTIRVGVRRTGRYKVAAIRLPWDRRQRGVHHH